MGADFLGLKSALICVDLRITAPPEALEEAGGEIVGAAGDPVSHHGQGEEGAGFDLGGREAEGAFVGGSE